MSRETHVRNCERLGVRFPPGDSTLSKSSLMNSTAIGKKEKLHLRGDILDPISRSIPQEIEKGKFQIDHRLGGIPGGKIFVSANKCWLGIVC
jgi:hypothetical protein